MLFVLESRSGLLSLFESLAESVSHLETVDIESREFEFCDETGQRFVGEITEPIGLMSSGRFRFRPDGPPNKDFAVAILSKAQSLPRPVGSIKTLEDLKRRVSPNHVPDPTSPSVTPPAGAGGAPSVAADH
jgi:hypothetical protein